MTFVKSKQRVADYGEGEPLADRANRLDDILTNEMARMRLTSDPIGSN